jgi:hypothetical protein
MELLKQAQDQLRALCTDRQLDLDQTVLVTVLSPDDAIGVHADSEFVIKKGKERVIEASWGEARGQAFTDSPDNWRGTVGALFDLDLSVVNQRAIFTAGLNAVLQGLEQAEGTIHCKDEEPTECGEKLTLELYDRFGIRRYGLIGLQPAILNGLVEGFGTTWVRVADLNADNIGQEKSGVRVWDGEKDLPKLVDWCDVGVATGSSIVNGTINDLRKRFAEAGKPLVFFGNTIAGVAALQNLERVCPFSH